MRTNRISHPRAQLLDQLRLVLFTRLERRRRPCVTLQVERPVPGEDVARRQLLRVAEDGVRRRQAVEREEYLERVEVDLAARQCTQLRGEIDGVAFDAIV